MGSGCAPDEGEWVAVGPEGCQWRAPLARPLAIVEWSWQDVAIATPRYSSERRFPGPRASDPMLDDGTRTRLELETIPCLHPYSHQRHRCTSVGTPRRTVRTVGWEKRRRHRLSARLLPIDEGYAAGARATSSMRRNGSGSFSRPEPSPARGNIPSHQIHSRTAQIASEKVTAALPGQSSRIAWILNH